MSKKPSSFAHRNKGRGRRRALKVVAGILVVVVALAAVLVVLAQRYDPVRVLYKRYKAPSEYVFEKVEPRYLETDPASLIHIGTPSQARAVRRDLVEAIWGSAAPFDRLPSKVERDYRLHGAGKIEGLARLDRLTIPVDEFYTAFAYRLYPAAPNGRTVLYHHGYGGTFVQSAALLSALLRDGYDIVALNNMGYGENRLETYVDPRLGPTDLGIWKFMDFVERPMRLYFDPAIVAINHVVRVEGRETVDAVGFSNGGWAVSVLAAVDPRIRRSYPVSGGYPIYLRAYDHKNQSQREHFYYPMLKAANYLDMYVLGTFGDAPRREMQIFNRYDRCCWRNRKGELYEPAVRAAAAKVGGGAFDVLIDESHADHKVSDFAISRILEDLKREPISGREGLSR
jgi:hypothetical protein